VNFLISLFAHLGDWMDGAQIC